MAEVPACACRDCLWPLPWALPSPPSPAPSLHPPAEALALVQHTPASGAEPGNAVAAHAAAALQELCHALQLLAAFCCRDPQTALELLHVELPAGGLEAGHRGPDLLSMACQAVAVLAVLPEPPTAAIGEADWLRGARAQHLPGAAGA